MDDVETVHLEKERPTRMAKISREMANQTLWALVSLLQKYQDIFSFGLVDMLGID